MNDKRVFGAIFDITSDMKRSDRQQIRSTYCAVLMALALSVVLLGGNLFAQDDTPRAQPEKHRLESEDTFDSSPANQGQLEQMKAVASDGLTPVLLPWS
jgi:hypothetical protein